MLDKKTFKTITQDIGRTFIIGDLHGEYDQLIELLDSVNFNYDEDICLAVGDLVDRGGKSLDCFNLLSKSWFRSVRGNHEQMCIDTHVAKDEFKNTCMENHIKYGGAWFYKLPMGVQKHIVERLIELPIAMILEKNEKKYLVVHGDIPNRYDHVDELKVAIESNDEFKSLEILYGRSLHCDCHNWETKQWVKEFGGVDMVYLGHTPVMTPYTNKNYTFVDTGCGLTDEITWGKLSIVEVL